MFHPNELRVIEQRQKELIREAEKERLAHDFLEQLRKHSQRFIGTDKEKQPTVHHN